MPIWSREPEDDARITPALVLLDTLSSAERRDLASARLRTALSELHAAYDITDQRRGHEGSRQQRLSGGRRRLAA